MRSAGKQGWADGAGVVELPDGRRIRGRSLRDSPPGTLEPDWGLYLVRKRPKDVTWPSRWVKWPDFWLPSDVEDCVAALLELHHRSGDGERVEIACGGGRGRTGTALACVAHLAGVPAAHAVAWVRTHYEPRAVETPWQGRFVVRFPELVQRRTGADR